MIIDVELTDANSIKITIPLDPKCFPIHHIYTPALQTLKRNIKYLNRTPQQQEKSFLAESFIFGRLINVFPL